MLIKTGLTLRQTPYSVQKNAVTVKQTLGVNWAYSQPHQVIRRWRLLKVTSLSLFSQKAVTQKMVLMYLSTSPCHASDERLYVFGAPLLIFLLAILKKWIEKFIHFLWNAGNLWFSAICTLRFSHCGFIPCLSHSAYSILYAQQKD